MADLLVLPQTPILVRWHDTISSPGWHCVEDILAELDDDAHLHLTVGFLVGTTPISLIVGQSLGVDEGNYGDLLSIPWGCVKHINLLTEGVNVDSAKLSQSNRLRLGRTQDREVTLRADVP